MKNKRGQIEVTPAPNIAVVTEKPRKSKWWLWLIIAIVIIAVIGIVAFLLLSSGAGDGGSSLLGAGSGVPTPPALPE